MTPKQMSPMEMILFTTSLKQCIDYALKRLGLDSPRFTIVLTDGESRALTVVGNMDLKEMTGAFQAVMSSILRNPDLEFGIPHPESKAQDN